MTSTLQEPKNLIEKDIYYSMTLNPNDKYQFAGKPDRMQLFRNTYYGIMVGWTETNYLFYTELSEPKNVNGTIGPRLHLHGFIKFTSNKAIKNFLLHEVYKLSKLGIVDIDTISDEEYWKKYCKKQQHIIMEKPLTNMQ